MEVRMRALFRTVMIAGATAAASWLVTRWLDASRAAAGTTTRHPVEQWENEGGALAPQQASADTSQVPR
jgi:hypothetical protein